MVGRLWGRRGRQSCRQGLRRRHKVYRPVHVLFHRDFCLEGNHRQASGGRQEVTPGGISRTTNSVAAADTADTDAGTAAAAIAVAASAVGA